MLQILHALVPEVWAAADRIAGTDVVTTPLLPAPWLLSAEEQPPSISAIPKASAHAAVYLKLENRQATGAFKARGAVNKVRHLFTMIHPIAESAQVCAGERGLSLRQVPSVKECRAYAAIIFS